MSIRKCCLTAVWESLDNYIHGLPRRHKLVVLGDFNSQLGFEPPLVGRGLQPSPAHDRSDKAKFQGIIRRHQLTAVNTFGAKSNAATFISEHGNSQIDYILARQNTCDQTSKAAQALPDAPLARWRRGGRHCPIAACFPTSSLYKPRLPTKLPPPALSAASTAQIAAYQQAVADDLDQLETHDKSATPSWHGLRNTCLCRPRSTAASRGRRPARKAESEPCGAITITLKPLQAALHGPLPLETCFGCGNI